jgi:hypothetical protein
MRWDPQLRGSLHFFFKKLILNLSKSYISLLYARYRDVLLRLGLYQDVILESSVASSSSFFTYTIGSNRRGQRGNHEDDGIVEDADEAGGEADDGSGEGVFEPIPNPSYAYLREAVIQQHVNGLLSDSFREFSLF